MRHCSSASTHAVRGIFDLIVVCAFAGISGKDNVLGWSSFEEENYACSAEPGFVDKCVPAWQEECRNVYAKSAELKHRLCETHLDRNYVRIRTLIPPADILEQWTWDKRRRDFDEGLFRRRLPHFTETGFRLTQLPSHLHEGMLQWYARNRNSARPEYSQPAFGMHCNTGHDNDDWQVPYVPRTSEDKRLFEDVKEWIRKQLADWTGQQISENTAIYGVRQYHRGSICGMHTDNIQTHAFSAIYQLDQYGMDEPWNLDYVTHEGVEGSHALKAGEVMLYESATGLHGRKKPLNGDEFANIFFHFRSPGWLPKVEKMLSEEYWPTRWSFESSTKRLTSLADAPKRSRQWRSDDQCIPLRSRYAPLMVEGHFMDTPDDVNLKSPGSKQLRAKVRPELSIVGSLGSGAGTEHRYALLAVLLLVLAGFAYRRWKQWLRNGMKFT
eukprot:TRINITY_DN11623_c1_g1_i1.p1 TRINITY_DN11623_c1_g1~~TRINITY_DN11623_c1_g1_i1.p1  ORF type:complete len:440 (-),score=57.93 TRINITY_DN11623_c1_g1_i1:55-1374(-)